MAVSAACGGTTDAGGSVSIALTSSTLALSQTGTAVVNVTVDRNDFDGALTITAEGLPAGVTAMSGTIAAGSNTGSITLTASSTAVLGAKNITIRVTGSGIAAKTATVSLTINASVVFTLGSTATSVTATAGGITTATISANRSNGFTGDVALTVTAPAGITAALSAATLTSLVQTAVLTITVGASVAPGTYNVVVHANSAGNPEQTMTITLTVAGAGGGFGISLGSASVNLTGGASVNVPVTINRVGGFTGNVTFTATVPSGVTATFNPSSTTGTTSTLTLAASSTVSTTSTQVTVRANASGQAEQTANLNLNLTGTTGGTGNVTWTFCSASGIPQAGIPVFVAVQDGTGAWTQVTGSNNVYSFNITTRGGITYVIPSNSGWDTEVFYGSLAELQAMGASLCAGSAGAGKTVTGSVAGAAIADLTNVTLGRAFTSVVGNSAFTLSNVLAGSLDLVLASSSAGSPPSKLLIQRTLNVAAGGSVGTINIANGVTPAQSTLTATGLGGDSWGAMVQYFTTNNTLATLYNDYVSASASATRPWYGFPSGSQAAGEVHVIDAVAAATFLATPTQTRHVIVATTSVSPKTVNFGPALAAPTVSVVATTPYVRLNLAHTLQSEYNKDMVVSFTQGTGASVRTATVRTTGAYLNGATSLAAQVPNLSSLAGYLATYGLQTGAATTWTLTATGWTNGSVIGGNYWVDGNAFLGATQMGTITP